MNRRIPRVFTVVLLLVPSFAAAQSIGIFADLESATCNISAPLYGPTNFYINAVGAGVFTLAGLAGAEFRVDHSIDVGVDALVTATPNPASSIALGDPMGFGCNVAFPECQSAASINLYMIQITPLKTESMTNKLLTVRPHVLSGPNFPCIILNRCDSPIFTGICVAGGEAWLNSNTNCTVALTDQTWTEIKNLFH